MHPPCQKEANAVRKTKMGRKTLRKRDLELCQLFHAPDIFALALLFVIGDALVV
jgi:hypothetical protein